MNDRAHVSEPAVPPVFQPTDEERLESLATTGRGPLRLAAAAVLAADHRRSARHAQRALRQAAVAAPAPPPELTPQPPPQPPPELTPQPPPELAPESRPAPAESTGPAPVAARRRAKTARAGVETPAPAAPAPPPRRNDRSLTRARLQRARSDHQAKLLGAPVDPLQKVADDTAWERWASNLPDPDGQEGFERLDEARIGRRLPRRGKAAVPAGPAAGKPSWRSRAGAVLDRLAEQEVARGARLEQRLIPTSERSTRA